MNLLIVPLCRGGVRTRLRLTIRRIQVMIKNLNLMSRISSQTM